MPKVNLGNVVGVGVGGGNWNQNDPLGDGYISDRPCYNNQETITWDGDTTGLETFTATAVKQDDGTETQLEFYMISERTPSAYDFDGNLVAEHKSISEAANSVSAKASNIVACCQGRQYSSNGFVWKYKDAI